jgi:hypothetical protein
VAPGTKLGLVAFGIVGTLALGLGLTAYLLSRPQGGFVARVGPDGFAVVAGGSFGSSADDAKARREAPLTPDEETAWRKKRREHPKPCYQLFGLRAGTGAWVAYGVTHRGRDGYGIGDTYGWLSGEKWGTEFGEGEYVRADSRTGKQAPVSSLDKAKEVAAEECRRPELKAVAVVDVYSGDRPAPVCWYRDDGRGAASASGPPPGDDGRTLILCLRGVQKAAAR